MIQHEIITYNRDYIYNEFRNYKEKDEENKSALGIRESLVSPSLPIPELTECTLFPSQLYNII